MPKSKTTIGTIEDTNGGKLLDFTKVFCFRPPSDGFFHLIENDLPKKNKYYQCRESFARHFKSQKSFGFHCPYFEDIKEVKEMIKWVEKELKIPSVKGAKFKSAKMRYGYMLVVKPGTWWKTNELRRQVLTAIIREASFDSKSSPQEKIKNSEDYFYNTHLKNNFNKFLKGYTHTDKNLTFNHGWMYHFVKKAGAKHLFKTEQSKKV